MDQRKNDDQYPKEEAQRRFLAAVKAALNTPPTPMKDVPRKWSKAKCKQRKKTRDAA